MSSVGIPPCEHLVSWCRYIIIVNECAHFLLKCSLCIIKTPNFLLLKSLSLSDV